MKQTRIFKTAYYIDKLRTFFSNINTQLNMPKVKKDKPVAVPLGEFLRIDGGNNSLPAFEVELASNLDGSSKKIIDLSKLPSAPKSSFEIIIKDEIIKKGPPYEMMIKNFPFDTKAEEICEFLENHNIKVEIIEEGFKSRGFAIAYFNDLAEYKAAFEKDGLKLGKRAITLIQGRVSEDSNKERDYFGSASRGNKYSIDQRGNFSRPSGDSRHSGYAGSSSSYGSSKYQSGQGGSESWSRGQSMPNSQADQEENWRVNIKRQVVQSEADQEENWRSEEPREIKRSGADLDDNWRNKTDLPDVYSEADHSDNLKDDASKKILRNPYRDDHDRIGARKLREESNADQDQNWRTDLRTSQSAQSNENNFSSGNEFKLDRSNRSHNNQDSNFNSFNKNSRFNRNQVTLYESDRADNWRSNKDRTSNTQEIGNSRTGAGGYRQHTGYKYRTNDTSESDQALSWRPNNPSNQEPQIKIKQRPKDINNNGTEPSNQTESVIPQTMQSNVPNVVS